MTKIVKDWMDKNIHHVLVDGKAKGYVKQFSPNEWKAFDASGKFLGYFPTKKSAVNAL